MIPIILSAAVSVVAGLLLGGCGSRSDTIIEQVAQENSTLQNQIQSHLAVSGILGVALTVVGSGLAAALFALHKRKRG